MSNIVAVIIKVEREFIGSIFFNCENVFGYSVRECQDSLSYIFRVRVRVNWGVLVCWSTPAFPRGREHVASTPVKGTSPKIMGSMIGFVLVASTWALSGPVVQGCEKALIGPLPFFLFCSILMNFVFFHQI